MDFLGTAGNDLLLGTAGSDRFDLSIHTDDDPSDGGVDHARGFGDNDILDFGQTFDVGDVADGGGGNDVLLLENHVGSSVVLDGTNLISIEAIALFHSEDADSQPVSSHFKLLFGTGLTSQGSTITINGTQLSFFDIINIDLTPTDGNTKFSVLTGASEGQVLCASTGTTVATSDGARMKVVGGAGRDLYSWTQTVQHRPPPGGAAAAAGNAFNVDSQYDGGGGNDSLTLWGDMSAGVVFKGLTMRNVETLSLIHGFNYDITLHNANVADDGHLTVDGRPISGAGSLFHLDASSEAGGDITVLGGGQNGVYRTGGGDDTIQVGAASVMNIIAPGSGHDHIVGAGQQDIAQMGAFFDALDRIDGVSGINDAVDLDGDYSAGLTLGGATIRNIDSIVLAAGHSYSLVFADANVASGKTMIVDGSALGTADAMTMKGTSESNGQFDFRGGDGDDTLTGGAKDDDFRGGGGADSISVGAGFDDLFYEGPVSDSTGLTHDIVKGFDVANDHIGLNFDIGAENTLAAGMLRAGHFDSDLAAAVNDTVLNPHGSTAFTPDAGSLAGHRFLVIDANGVAGYQAGQDFVIEFVNPAHWSSAFNFFTGA